MNQDQASALVSSLFESWYSTLVRYAFRVAGSTELAEDAVQETFMLLYRELCQGKRIENCKGWTVCVLRRELNRRVRSHSLVSNEPLDVLDAMPAVVSCHTRVEADLDDVSRLLYVLTKREEEVVLLRMGAMKYREIAEQLSISPKSVNTLLARALRKLRMASKIRSREQALPNYVGSYTPKTLQ